MVMFYRTACGEKAEGQMMAAVVWEQMLIETLTTSGEVSNSGAFTTGRVFSPLLINFFILII